MSEEALQALRLLWADRLGPRGSERWQGRLWPAWRQRPQGRLNGLV